MTQAWACLLLGVVSLLVRHHQAFILRAPAQLKLLGSPPNNHNPVSSPSRVQQEATALRMADGDGEQEGPGLSVKAAW